MATIPELENLLNALAEGLPKVSARRMFGCHALFANDAIFALVWKEGRLGLKLTEEADYQALRGTPGAAPWRAGKMEMAHWVLVPQEWHEDRRGLAGWVRRAHAQALSAPPKTKKPAKKAAKPAPRKTAAKKKNAGAKKRVKGS